MREPQSLCRVCGTQLHEDDTTVYCDEHVAEAIVIVPAPGDPGGLVTAETPLVHRRLVEMGEPRDMWCDCGDRSDLFQQAIPLWWDGALVSDGWDRARQVWTRAPGRTPLAIGYQVDVSLAQAEMIGMDLVRLGLASRVVRLRRLDGRLVEIAP